MSGKYSKKYSAGRKAWSEDTRQLFAMLATWGLIFGAVVVAGVLVGGCTLFAEKPPAFVTTETPALPEECIAPTTPEPKFPGGGKRIVEDDEAARDREHLRFAYRNEAILRSACRQQLEALFPQPEAKP
jgi:hypothetical protein